MLKSTMRAGLLALSLLVAGCALDEMEMSEEDGLVTEPATGDEMTDEMTDEDGTDPRSPDPASPEPGSDEIDLGSEASCKVYGQRCASTSECCSGMTCSFDGYIRYCRH